MDVLKAEMERKRKEREALTATADGGKKKWVKRGDVEKMREEQYRLTEAKEAEERKARLKVPCLRYRRAAMDCAASCCGL
eukprot:2145527-Pleurochrysis_carterae.AAC.1